MRIHQEPNVQWLLEEESIQRVVEEFPFRTTRHYSQLMKHRGDAIGKQMIPDMAELRDGSGYEDPLAEESLSPVPNLVHRYPNRVLWLVSHECAMNCRFCTRKRRWKNPLPLTEEDFQRGLGYISSHREIRDVLLSGGDPLLLPLDRLDRILSSLKSMEHVQVIRIGSRIPCVLPEKIQEDLAALLAKHHPVFVNLHFNHPREINGESRRACECLADAGIPLGSQTVLLKGVNDDGETLGELFQNLLTMRVKPYYLLQMDLTRSTSHFRTPLSEGLKILKQLRNHISGLAMPQFVIDLPGGHGKIPLLPHSVEELRDDAMVVRDFRGDRCSYPLLPGECFSLRKLMGF